jgi:hypothetical protein
MGAPKDDVARMLEGIPVKPGDEKILDTPFGKMITKFAAPDTDKKTLIREVKKALEQYVQSLTAEMKRQMKRSEEAIKKMGKVSRGERED